MYARVCCSIYIRELSDYFFWSFVNSQLLKTAMSFEKLSVGGITYYDYLKQQQQKKLVPVHVHTYGCSQDVA